MKRKPKRIDVVLMAGAIVLVAAAATVAVVLIAGALTVPAVAGFALVEGRGDERVYVTPEGFYCRFYAEENYPAKDLAFWRDALRNKMDVSGYTALHEEGFSSAQSSACYLEWGAPLGNEDYVYATALAVKDGRLYVGEAAGEMSLFRKYRAPIVAAFRELVR
jgi:hypothetical protein